VDDSRLDQRQRIRLFPWLSVVIASLLVLVSAGAAAGASERFRDADDHQGFDIRRVEVRYGDRLTIRVAHDGEIGIGQKYKYWLDTDIHDPGPEYSLAVKPNSDYIRFRVVDGFNDTGTSVTSCGRRWGGAADIFRPHHDVLAFVGARCFRSPNRIRVSVQLVVDGPDDWAPGFHHFYARVARY
jgi:hypothetical protein